MKKKILLVTASLIALGAAAPAVAADLAARPYTKAPPMVAAIATWSGFYVGINGGGGSAHSCWDNLTIGGGALIGRDGCHDATGGTVGGQIGYRWQAANWVFGLEAQGNWADFSASNVSPVGPTVFSGLTDRTRIDSFGLFTGQVGYAWNNVLGYVKGGAAVVGDRFDVFTPAGVNVASGRDTRWGATVGAGLEVGFAQNWSVGVEYDHIFLGDRNYGITTPAGVVLANERISQNVDMGLVRLNYKFGGVIGAPVAARY